jgi:hypothetical protein
VGVSVERAVVVHWKEQPIDIKRATFSSLQKK